ncbi:MAG: zinc-ribbon domain-containing protein [Acidobacteria bacterium]|nr:zinc-ribbon domain-containing protein [Acidobacteriota bacterium]
MDATNESKLLIACPSCHAKFKVPSSRIPPQGSRVACPRCKSPFVLKPDGSTTAIPTPPTPQTPPAAPPAPPPATTTVDNSAPAAPADLPPPAGAPSAPEEVQWRLDVPDYAEYTFTFAELKKLVRDGGFYPADKVTRVGEESWVEANQVPEFRRLFELKEMMARKKAETGKLAAPASGVGAAAPPAQIPCTNHPQWEAGYRCRKCGKSFCHHCVDVKQAGASRYMACRACNDICTPLDKSVNIAPFYTSLPLFFSAPLKGWGPLMLLINGAMLWLSQSMLLMFVPAGKYIFKAFVLAYLIWIVKSAARGRESVPDWPDVSDWMDLAKIGMRASAVTFISFLPWLAFLALAWQTDGFTSLGFGSSEEEPTQQTEMIPIPGSESMEIPQVMPEGTIPAEGGEGGGGTGLEPPDTSWVEQMAVQQGGGAREDMSVEARQQMEERQAEERAAEERATDRAAAEMSSFLEKGIVFIVGSIICFVFAFIYYPMGLAVTSVWDVVKPILNPFFIFRLIRRVLGDYVIFLLIFGLLLAVQLVANAGLTALIPYVGSIFGSLVFIYFSFVISFALGRFCYSNDRRLGWEEEIYPGR